MTERVHIDAETRALLHSIESVIADAEFSAVCTALEAVLARRIKREQGGVSHPGYAAIAGQMVARHVMALMDCEGLLDG